MKKIMLGISLIVLLLAGCGEPPEEYVKTKGEVIGKHISGGRHGDFYYIEVSYPIRDGKFSIDSIYVEKEEYSDFHIKDVVTVYGNKDGIGGIVK